MERFHLKFWLPILCSCVCLILTLTALLMFVVLNTGVIDTAPGFLVNFYKNSGQWVLAGMILLMMMSPVMLAILLPCSISWLKQHGKSGKNRLPLVLTLVSQIPLLLGLILSQIGSH